MLLNYHNEVLKIFKQFCNFVIKRLNEEILIKAEKLYLIKN